MSTVIEAHEPSTWEDLERMVTQILNECGMDVVRKQTLRLARGSVDVDVYAKDSSTAPPSTILVECKNWKRRTSKGVVHAFRTVVGEAGANVGFLVSSAGFQRGAVDAAEYTNLQLMDWHKFQSVFVERWYKNYMVPALRTEADPLVEYTEPINSRIFRKADQLTADKKRQFIVLRKKHFQLGLGLIPLWLPVLGGDGPPAPDLPLRKAYTLKEDAPDLPNDVLDATALRPLLTALTNHYRQAITEFDAVFGERA